MAEVAVVTDSTASLSPGQADRYGITIIPLQVVIDECSQPESHPQHRQNGGATPALVAQALRAGKRVTTSRPSPEAFAATYRRLADDGFHAIVSAHLSEKMSGTCAAARLGAQDAPVPVTVVDTRTIAMATGFAVLAAAEVAEAGADLDSVAAAVRRSAAVSETYFYVHSLEFLRRGGRIGAAAAMLGSALAVKPLLRMVDGEITPHERVRTEARALARLEELAVAALARAAGGSDRVDVAVHHLDDAPGAAGLVARLRGRVSTIGEIGIYEMSAVLGVHVGPGTLGVVLSPQLSPGGRTR